MNHLTIEQLVALRDAGSEPGSHAAKAHLDTCPACRAELDRLHQRVARLKALTPLRPARDRFPAVRAQLVADRRRRQARWVSVGGLAMAASVALFMVLSPADPAGSLSTQAYPDELAETMTRSQQLEQALLALDPEARLLDGRTAAIAGRIEDRIHMVDRDLQAADLLDRQVRTREQLRLWRERVGLLDALVDVHVTRASYAGL
ncbi:MAG TPA: hypothetical protein VMK53_05755 [Gemmatimonadales bacterium]|nr:hypothetical protein [Gemmatimonadales bacterium]